MTFCFYPYIYILFMKRRHIFLFLVIMCLGLFSISCSSDLDFNQTKNLKLEPTYIANLVYFDIPANEFVTNGVENSQFIDRSTVDIFNSTFFVNDLAKVDLDFEINNTIARAYTLDIKLFNASGIQIDTISIAVPSYYGAPNIITQKEIFQGTRLMTLKNTTRIEMTLRMASGTALTESSPGTIKMRSGITAYFVIQ